MSSKGALKNWAVFRRISRDYGIGDGVADNSMLLAFGPDIPTENAILRIRNATLPSGSLASAAAKQVWFIVAVQRVSVEGTKTGTHPYAPLVPDAHAPAAIQACVATYVTSIAYSPALPTSSQQLASNNQTPACWCGRFSVCTLIGIVAVGGAACRRNLVVPLA
eukprot:6214264-Pleurochrysis_carterae.AAC.1